MPVLLLLFLTFVSVFFVHHISQWLAGRFLGVRIRWLLLLPSGADARMGRQGFTLLSGSLANVLVAVLLGFVAVYWGGVQTVYYRIDDVVANSPSDGKLAAGDRILAIDGQPLFFGGTAMQDAVQRAGDPLTVTVDRAGTTVDVSMSPIEQDGARRIGVKLGPAYVSREAGFGEAVVHGFTAPFGRLWNRVRDVWRNATSAEPEASGPVGITRMIRSSTASAPWVSVVAVVAYYHLLAAFLYLPIDAGRFFAVLAARRRARRMSQPANRQIY